jgi:hypothetical protein
VTVAQAERAGAVTPAQAERADTADPRLDTILDDRFHLVACLGTGGMGVVYRATQLSVGRDVALKVMGRRPSDLANERFLREARTGAGNERCSHGRAWLDVDGDRVVGAAVSDLGQVFEIVGTRKPSGAIFGAFTLHEHTIGAFEGQLRDGHARGTTNGYAFDCTGSFDLTRDP